MNAAMIFICNEKGLSCCQERESGTYIERKKGRRKEEEEEWKIIIMKISPLRTAPFVD